jgi:hypothetical protein
MNKKSWVLVIGIFNFLGISTYAVASEMSVSADRAYERAMQWQEERLSDREDDVQPEISNQAANDATVLSSKG